MNRFMTLMTVTAVIAGASAAAQAGIIYQAPSTISVDGNTVEASGAGSIDNSDLGADRTLIISYGVIRTTDDPDENGDAWAAAGIGFDNTPGGGAAPTDVVGFNSSEESDAAGLARTLDSIDSGRDHKIWIDGNDTAGDDVDIPDVLVGPNGFASGRIRMTFDLSANGMQTGESFTLTLEIDEDDDGTFDVSGSSSGTWSDATNYIWLGSRGGNDHDFTDFTVESIPEPATLALLGLGGAVMLGGRRRKA